jgi:hypothetical protein
LVFGSSVLEMSSRRQATAAMLYATWGKQRMLGAPCRHHCRHQEGVLTVVNNHIKPST